MTSFPLPFSGLSIIILHSFQYYVNGLHRLHAFPIKKICFTKMEIIYFIREIAAVYSAAICLCRRQHGFDKCAVALGRLVQHHMGHCAHQFPVLQDRAAAHALNDATR